MREYSKDISVIGAGFSGIAAAATLAKAGHNVTVFEKNGTVGGRARQFKENGFVFDMGPSWYWMPDVFEEFFNAFGKSASDYYDLKKLTPAFSVFFKDNERVDIPNNEEELVDLFESIEKGAGDKLKKFMASAAYKYDVGINKLVRKPSKSVFEFLDWELMTGIFKLKVFTPFDKYVRQYFKDPRLISLMEFPVLFLGSLPSQIPALYSLMNYAGLSLGTWYPMGGFYKIIEGMKSVAEEQGVDFKLSSPIDRLNVSGNKIQDISLAGKTFKTDGVLASADYHHVDRYLVPEGFQQYSEKYWDSRTMAPSSLIFYIGVDKKIGGLNHHNLFFDEDFQKHAFELYEAPKWPSKPLFYVCCPSKTDPSVAPAGKENLFILIPIAPDLEDNDVYRKAYFKIVMDRLEDITGEQIRPFISYKKSYAVKDFKEDYNAFKGNAYGLANTLTQTAIFKPSLAHKHIRNLYYSGQLTVPGPGVPPSIISGQLAANELMKNL